MQALFNSVCREFSRRPQVLNDVSPFSGLICLVVDCIVALGFIHTGGSCGAWSKYEAVPEPSIRLMEQYRCHAISYCCCYDDLERVET